MRAQFDALAVYAVHLQPRIDVQAFRATEPGLTQLRVGLLEGVGLGEYHVVDFNLGAGVAASEHDDVKHGLSLAEMNMRIVPRHSPFHEAMTSIVGAGCTADGTGGASPSITRDYAGRQPGAPQENPQTLAPAPASPGHRRTPHESAPGRLGCKPPATAPDARWPGHRPP